MKQKLDVLLVEDSEDDAALVLRELREGGYEISHQRVCTRDSMAAALDEKRWDIVLADHNMPEFDSLGALALVKARKLDVPFIIVSGAIGEETAVAAMKAGAHDFVMKGNLARLAPAVGRELREAENRRMRSEAEEGVQRSEKRFRDLVDNLSEVVVEADIEGNITYVSAQAEALYGFKPEEILGRNIADLIHPDDLGIALEALSKVTSGAPFFDFEFRTAHRDGRFIPSTASARMVEEGGNHRIVGVLKDITERNKAVDALGRSEQLFRLLAENSRDLVFRIRLQPGPSVEYISPSALALTGSSPEEFLSDGALAARLLPPGALDGAAKNPKRKGDLGGPRTISWQRPDGAAAWLELVSHPVLNAAGTLVAVEGAGRDVTERMQIEDALRESEEKFRNLAENSPNMIFINVKGRVVYANHRWEEIMGYTREEFGSPGFDFLSVVIAPEHREAMQKKYRRHLRQDDLAPDEHVVVTKVGRRIPVILSTALIRYGGEDAILGTLTDISELRRSEEALKASEEKYRELVENINDVIFSVDQGGVVTYISPAVEQILGFRPEEATGSKFTDFVFGEDLERVRSEFGTTLTGQLGPSEFRMRTKKGDLCWVRTSSRPILSSGIPSGLSGVLEDITARKRSEEKIRASLDEKVVLLKEIHHRVKNNLQIIHSLLNMQARQTGEPAALDAIRESQNRVRTMALIHERLYMSSDLANINLKEYLPQLARELYSSFGADPDRIRLELDIGDVRLGVDSAIPCGLVVNELLSNSLKHGFPDGGRGAIRVAAASGPDGAVRLEVGDTGAGLPEGLDFRKTRSLGLQLVCTLVDQLRGAVSLGRGRGTVFTIEFCPGNVEGA